MAPVTPAQTPAGHLKAPCTLDRREGPYGEVVLRQRGAAATAPGTGGPPAPGAPVIYEIIANGCFLMDTSDGRSERLLIDAALDALPAGRPRPSVLTAASASASPWRARRSSRAGAGSSWSNARRR